MSNSIQTDSTVWPPPPAGSQSPTPIVPHKALTLVSAFWYSLANLGFGAFYAFNNYSIPLWLSSYTNNAMLLGMMGATHSFEGVLIQPVIGSMSDRLRTRFGRRRPFLMIFVPLSALFLVLAPHAAHLPIGMKLAGIVTCIVLFTISFNVALDPYQALMTDITTTEQRGRVSGLWYFVGATGQVAILLTPMPLQAKFALVAGLMLVTALLTCAFVHEPKRTDHPKAGAGAADGVRLAMSGLAILRQVRRYLIAYVFYGVGIGVVVPFISLFIKTVTHCDNHHAELMSVVLMLTTALGGLPLGLVSDKIGAKSMLTIGFVLICCAALGGLFVHTLPQVALVMILAGLGTAAQNASAYPLLTRLVPEEEIGFYIGLQAASLSACAPLAILLTGALVQHGGYRMIFVVCAICVIAGLIVLQRVRPELAADEVSQRDAEQGRGMQTVLAPA